MPFASRDLKTGKRAIWENLPGKEDGSEHPIFHPEKGRFFGSEYDLIIYEDQHPEMIRAIFPKGVKKGECVEVGTLSIKKRNVKAYTED